MLCLASTRFKLYIIKKSILVFDTPQVVNCFKVESDAALLPSLTGNWVMIEKLVLGEI